MRERRNKGCNCRTSTAESWYLDDQTFSCVMINTRRIRKISLRDDARDNLDRGTFADSVEHGKEHCVSDIGSHSGQNH